MANEFVNLSSSGSIYFPETGHAPALFLQWYAEHKEMISNFDIRLVYQDNIDDPNCFFVSFDSANTDNISQAKLYKLCVSWIKNNL